MNTESSGDASEYRPIRIGSRGSVLALIQANWVADRLRERGVPAEIEIIRTAGDVRAPDTAWGEGAFVTAIEEALLDGTVDVAVHSAKDVPTDEDPRLAIAAWTTREDPRDALVCRIRGMTLDTLPIGARVGTDSPRRSAFLRARRPDLEVHALNGNVDTRLRKLDEGQSDALILAVAGLTRLGKQERIDQILPLEVAVPAPGQGVLALQARADDARSIDSLASLDDHDARTCAQTERTFLAATGGGCRSPIGALAEVRDNVLTLHVAAERDAVPGIVHFDAQSTPDAWRQLALDLAARVVRARSRARVLVTRPYDDARSLGDALDAAGFDAVVVPTIEIRFEHDEAFDAVLASAADVNAWLVATSPNGVKAALAAFDRLGTDPAQVRWAVVGGASAAPLDQRAIEPFLPSRPLRATVADELPLEPGDSVHIVSSDLADGTLAQALRARGALVTERTAYRTIEGPAASASLLHDALELPLDALIFASGSAVRGLMKLADPTVWAELKAKPAVCIGPSTLDVARELGLDSAAEAADPTADALVAAVKDALQHVHETPTPVAAGDVK